MPPARSKTRNRQADEQDWGMLIFESISAGGMAIFFSFVVVLLLAGVYGLVIWPITHWDFAQVDGGSLWKWGLGFIFTAGTTTGFWVFSGAAFRKKANPPASKARIRR